MKSAVYNPDSIKNFSLVLTHLLWLYKLSLCVKISSSTYTKRPSTCILLRTCWIHTTTDNLLSSTTDKLLSGRCTSSDKLLSIWSSLTNHIQITWTLNKIHIVWALISDHIHILSVLLLDYVHLLMGLLLNGIVYWNYRHLFLQLS